MEEVKSVLASKTVWGGILAVLAAVAGFLGYTVTPADQVALMEIGAAVVGAVGGVLAIYGRIVATKRIGS